METENLSLLIHLSVSDRQKTDSSKDEQTFQKMYHFKVYDK